MIIIIPQFEETNILVAYLFSFVNKRSMKWENSRTLDSQHELSAVANGEPGSIVDHAFFIMLLKIFW